MSIHLLPRPICVAAFVLMFFLSGCALLGGESTPDAADPSLTTAATTVTESAATESEATGSEGAAIATFTPAATTLPAEIATAAVITLESAVEATAPPVTAITDTITSILTDSITATLILLATPTPATDQANAGLSLLPTVTPTTATVPIEGGALLTTTEPSEPSAPDASITDVITSTEGISGTAPLSAPVAPPAALPPGTFTITSTANLRGGPGTDYPVAGAGNVGQAFTAQGRNETSDWLQICCVNEQPVWIFAPLGTLVGPVESLAIVAAPPLSTTPITNTVAPDVALPVTTTESAPPVVPAEPAPAATEAAPASATPAPVEEPAAAVPVIPAAVVPAAMGSYPYPPGGPIVEHPGTAGEAFPDAQYQIIHFKVLGADENNGGIFNSGGQHHIFIKTLDAAGNPVDGVVLKDAIGDKLSVVSGSKGSGSAEMEMYWDGYKLYVASDSSGPVTSQISNRLNLSYPHIPDIIGKLGSADVEYAVCPTPDDRCTPPFHHVHFSYEITFQKVR